MKKEHEVISNRKMSDREKELWEELQKLAKFMYEKFPEYETTNDESFVHKAIRIIVDLKSQLAECKEHYDYQAHLVNSLYKQISDLIDENKALEKQLASVKYLNTDEVEHIIGSINTNQEKIQAICNLAIPEIKQKREDIIEILSRKHMDFLTREEIIKEQTNEIIKAIRGEE